MKTNNYLFPTPFRKIGWTISIPTAVVLLCYLFSSPWEAQPPTFFSSFKKLWMNVTDVFCGGALFAAICMVLLMIGLLFIAFSKEKTEDEFITKLRSDSLIWAVLANAVLMALLSVLIYGGWFLFVSFFNLYSVLVLFIIKFNLAMNKFKKEIGNEE